MSFAWKGSIGPPVRKASKILESKAGNFPYGIVISSLPPFSNLWKMEFVFKKEKGKKKEFRTNRLWATTVPQTARCFPLFRVKFEKRKKGKKERERERKEEKKFQGERMKNGKSWWSRFCRRIKEGGNIAGEYCFRLFALKSDKSPDKKLSYPKREFQSSLTLPVGEVWRWKICAKLGLTKRESRGERKRGEKIPYRSHGYWTDSLSPNSLMFRRITAGREAKNPRQGIDFFFIFLSFLSHVERASSSDNGRGISGDYVPFSLFSLKF